MLNRRTAIIWLLALAVALLVLRNAVVQSFAGPNPAGAAAAWPGHPSVLLSKGLTEIGIAATRRQPPPPGALADINRAAAIAPLTHDPLLVRGIVAQQAGDFRLAERAFLAARQRAPREPAPRYFLAQLYLTSGRGGEGLRELATLARLLPHGPASVAPALAAYARTSGDIASLRATFRDHPVLEDAVLTELAKDAGNADLAVRLASRLRTTDGKAPDWVRGLLPRLVDVGQFEKAHRLWATVSGEPVRGAVFDPAFRGSSAPPPFNWTLRSDSTGFAESDNKGGLHVYFYGREDSVLASQLLRFSPGRYRIAMKVSGNPGGMLRWSLTCLPAKAELLNLPLGAAASSAPAAEFRVDPACSTQLLELKGSAGETVREADSTISGLTVSGGDGDR